MAKGEAKTTNTMIDSQIKNNQGFQNDYNKELLDASHNSYNQGTTERANINQGYNAFAQTGGVSDEDRARLRGLYTGVQASAGSGGGSASPSYTYSGGIAPVENKYSELMNGGGVNRYALGTLQDLSGKNGGWSDSNLANMNQSTEGYKNIGQTGGYSAAGLGTINNSISGLSDIGRTGGYDEAAVGRIRNDANTVRGSGTLDAGMMGRFNEGLTGYSDLAKTGGWNDQTKQDYMNQATGVIPAMYAGADRAARNQAQVQGGSPGLSYALRNNMRAASADAQSAAREGRLGMENSILQNKQAGLAGLSGNSLSGANAISDAAYRAGTGASGIEQGLEQALTSNRLAGLTGAGSMAQNSEQAQVQNRLSGLGGIASNTLGMQNSINDSRLGASNALNNLSQLDLQASLAGTQGLEGVIQNKAQESASAASAANSAANASFNDKMQAAKLGLSVEQYLMDSTNANKLSGLSGLGGMYSAVNNEYQNGVNNVLGNQGQGNQSINQNLGLRAQYNPNVSGWDRVNQTLGTIGQVGGAVAGAMSGNPAAAISAGTKSLSAGSTGGFLPWSTGSNNLGGYGIGSVVPTPTAPERNPYFRY